VFALYTRESVANLEKVGERPGVERHRRRTVERRCRGGEERVKTRSWPPIVTAMLGVGAISGMGNLLSIGW
jgi:hypothetical protein